MAQYPVGRHLAAAAVVLGTVLAACSSTTALLPTPAAEGLTVCEAATAAIGTEVRVTARFKDMGRLLLEEPDPGAEVSEADRFPSPIFEADERCHPDQDDTAKLIVVGATPDDTEQMQALGRGTWATVAGTVHEVHDEETTVVLIDASLAG